MVLMFSNELLCSPPPRHRQFHSIVHQNMPTSDGFDKLAVNKIRFMDAYKARLVEEKLVKTLERYRIYVAVAVVVIHRGVVAVGFKKEDVGKLGFVKGKEAHEEWGLST